MREHRPIYPKDGQIYTDAIAEAEAEYNAWLLERNDKIGLQLLAVRKLKPESANANIRSEGNKE